MCLIAFSFTYNKTITDIKSDDHGRSFNFPLENEASVAWPTHKLQIFWNESIFIINRLRAEIIYTNTSLLQKKWIFCQPKFFYL